MSALVIWTSQQKIVASVWLVEIRNVESESLETLVVLQNKLQTLILSLFNHALVSGQPGLWTGATDSKLFFWLNSTSFSTHDAKPERETNTRRPFMRKKLTKNRI